MRSAATAASTTAQKAVADTAKNASAAEQMSQCAKVRAIGIALPDLARVEHVGVDRPAQRLGVELVVSVDVVHPGMPAGVYHREPRAMANGSPDGSSLNVGFCARKVHQTFFPWSAADGRIAEATISSPWYAKA